MKLYAHPFSSYCWKAEIAFHELGVPYQLQFLSPDNPKAGEELAAMWPLAKMPLLVDGEAVVFEATAIIEHLNLKFGGSLIPAGEAGVRVRMMDRVFDNYVMTPMQTIVGDALRPEGAKDAYGVEQSKKTLDTAYAWLDGQLAGGGWACGAAFTMADIAAAPSLFYADWACEIPEKHAALKAYRARLLGRPSVARAVDEARPFRPFFPLGAPDRD